MDLQVSALAPFGLAKALPLGNIRPRWAAMQAWWDLDSDRDLVIGSFLHGFGAYSKMRSDPRLCYASKVKCETCEHLVCISVFYSTVFYLFFFFLIDLFPFPRTFTPLPPQILGSIMKDPSEWGMQMVAAKGAGDGSGTSANSETPTGALTPKPAAGTGADGTAASPHPGAVATKTKIKDIFVSVGDIFWRGGGRGGG